MTEGATPAEAGARLRLRRLSHGLSQEQLAQASRVSRQAIAGMESGRWAPSLRVALAIARALDASVEDLFGTGADLPIVEAVSVEPDPPSLPWRATLASVAGTTVAFPLTGHAATDIGFRPASAVVEDAGTATGPARPPVASARQISLLTPTVVIAGCDPALPLLSVPLSHLDPPLELLWWPCGSDSALELLGRGLVHVAGVHHPEGGPHAPAPGGDADAMAVGFATWREGLMVRPELAHAVRGLEDVARLGARLVNRDRGSEARRLLDDERRRLGIDTGSLKGYATEVPGHLPVASAVASGLGDVGVGCEPAALIYALGFVALATERCELVMRRRDLEGPEAKGVLQALQSGWLRSQLAALPGYDVTPCGVPSGPA